MLFFKILFACLIGSNFLGATDIKYIEIPNDPLNTRIYTLENGLTVFLSKNTIKPNIHSYIAVKAGSSYDPADNTGLAHYLEHRLLKGTSKFGTNDWQKEKFYLDRITLLYEQHKKESDPIKKKNIYHAIDSVSKIASTFAIPNEFDKMMSSIGANGVNAFTSFDQTVYTEEIPANQLEKWAIIESERMSNLVLRIFHTELEAVYEEFNIGQDDDANQAFDALMNGLFPSHPYGTQTTIGLGAHLKNPSMLAIDKYFRKYYVPNNMAICLSGDLDYETTMQIITKHFGTWKRSDQLRDTINIPNRITKSIVREVFGPKEEYVLIGYGAPRFSPRESILMLITDALLANQKAGLLDLNLVQPQKVLDASTLYSIQKDAAIMALKGNPREGQSLEEVRALLYKEIEKLKTGQFDASNITAAIKLIKLRKMKEHESNEQRAYEYMDVFTRNQNYDSAVYYWNQIDQITKNDILEFVNKLFTYDVTVFKKNGNPKGIVKVEKPAITPIETNRNMESNFVKKLVAMPENKISPRFLDYNKDILEIKLSNGILMNYVKNQINPTFNLHYILDMGSLHDKKLAIALQYLPYLGTEKLNAEQLQLAFFKLGVSMDVSCMQDKMYISLSGLEESLEPALLLFEDVLKNVIPDEMALQNLKDGILKERADEKLNKQIIFWKKLSAYAQYGMENPENYVLSNKELKDLSAIDLTNKIKSLLNYKHRVFYFGQKEISEVRALLEADHKVNSFLINYPVKKEFNQIPTNENEVLYVEYNMVQAEVGMFSYDVKYNPSIVPAAKLFNEYFGGGMGSIVFQEIRESKALAYSTFSAYVNAKEKERYNYVIGYVGTQADKMKSAIDAMKELLNKLQYSENLF